jgi:integrase
MALKAKGGMHCKRCGKPVMAQKNGHGVRNAIAVGGSLHTKEGRAVRHGLFMREMYRPAIVGDPHNEDASKRRPPALPAEKANLRFHDLRHTCASLLVAQGSPMLYVKERLGHASVTTTINQYGHMFPSVEASLADALDEMYDDPKAAEGH